LRVALNAGGSGRTVPGDIWELTKDGFGIALRNLLTIEKDEVPEVGSGVEQDPHARRGDPFATVQVEAGQALAFPAQQFQSLVCYLNAERVRDKYRNHKC